MVYEPVGFNINILIKRMDDILCCMKRLHFRYTDQRATTEIIEILKSHPVLSTKDIIAFIGYSSTHVYKVCDKLADAGVLLRVPTSKKRNNWKLHPSLYKDRVLADIGDQPVTRSVIYATSMRLGVSAKTVRDCLKPVMAS